MTANFVYKYKTIYKSCYGIIVRCRQDMTSDMTEEQYKRLQHVIRANIDDSNATLEGYLKNMSWEEQINFSSKVLALFNEMPMIGLSNSDLIYRNLDEHQISAIRLMA